MKLFKVTRLILLKPALFCLCVFTAYGGSAFTRASAATPYPVATVLKESYRDVDFHVGLLVKGMRRMCAEGKSQQRYVAGIKINSKLDPLPMVSWLEYSLDLKEKRILEVSIEPDIAGAISFFYQLCVNYGVNSDQEMLEDRKAEKMRQLKDSFARAFQGTGKIKGIRRFIDNFAGVFPGVFQGAGKDEGKGVSEILRGIRARCDNERGNNERGNKKEIEFKLLLSSNSEITPESYLKGLSELVGALYSSCDSIVIMPNNIAPVKRQTFPKVNSVEIQYLAEKYFRQQPLGSDEKYHAINYLLSIGNHIKYHINIGSVKGASGFNGLTGEYDVPEVKDSKDGKDSLVFIMEQEDKIKVYIVHYVVNVAAQSVPGGHWITWLSEMLRKFQYAGT